MKNLIMVMIASVCFHFANAQSVGINTDGSAPAPGSMLDIKKAGKSKVSIRSTAFDDTTEMQFSNRNIINQGTDFNFTFIRELGFFITNESDLIANNNDSLFTILSNGNVGIGTRSPVSKLDVIGSLKITDGSQGAGKVLTSNTSGVASWQNPDGPTAFSATGSYPAISNFQNIATGIETKVTVINLQERDDGNMFDPALTRATIPTSGWYHIDLSLSYSLAEPGNYSISLEKFSSTGVNLGAIRIVQHEIPAGLTDQDFQLGLSCDNYFTAGQYLEINTIQTSGVQQRITGGAFSWFNMHRIK